MRLFGEIFSALVLFIASSLGRALGADISPDVLRNAAIATATEAALTTSAFIKDRTPGRPLKGGWTINFSDRNWVFTFNGPNEMTYTIAGFVWGADNEDWLVTFSGLGHIGAEQIFINGKAIWKYDTKLSDHSGMEFDNVVKYGAHSFWGWARGAEVVVGASIGAAGGIIAGGGAAGPVGAVVVGIAGALGGASGAATISDVAKEFVEAKDPVPPTASPKPPSIPKNEQELPPTKDMIAVAVFKSGEVRATWPSESLFLAGGLQGRHGNWGT